MTGPDIRLLGDQLELPGYYPGAANLQFATQVFIKNISGNFWPQRWGKRTHVYFKAGNHGSADFFRWWSIAMQQAGILFKFQQDR